MRLLEVIGVGVISQRVQSLGLRVLRQLRGQLVEPRIFPDRIPRQVGLEGCSDS